MDYHFDWSILIQEPYLGWLINGAWLTILLTLLSSIVSLAMGVGLAFLSLSRNPLYYQPARLYINITRNIPGIFWILFFFFVFPQILPSAAGNALNTSAYFPLIAGVIGLSVDNSPYVAEIIRSAVSAIPAGQWESAMACGLSPAQSWRTILLPQAFRVSAGPLGTRLIHNFKNTSLCMAIAVPELTWASRQVESLTFRGIEALTAATVFYLLLGLLLATLVNYMENRFDQAKSNVRS